MSAGGLAKELRRVSVELAAAQKQIADSQAQEPAAWTDGRGRVSDNTLQIEHWVLLGRDVTPLYAAAPILDKGECKCKR